MIVAGRFVRDRRRAVAWWAAGLVGLVLMVVAFFPSIEGDAAYDEMLADLPESVRVLVGAGAEPLTSAPGYLQSQHFATMLPLLLLVCGIGLGARAIAGGEEDGTLELVVAHPVTRRRVAAERFAAVAALLAVLAVVSTVAVLAGAAPFGALDGVSLPGLVAANAGALLLALAHATLAFAVGATTGRRALALGVASAVAAAGYVHNGFLASIEALAPTRFLNPWHWFLGRNMLSDGVAVDALVVPLVVVAVLATAGVAAFERRDLH